MQAKAIYAKLITARESAILTRIWQRLELRQRSGKALNRKKGRLQVC